MKPETKPVLVRLSLDAYARLSQVAAEQRRSMGGQGAMLLEELLLGDDASEALAPSGRPPSSARVRRRLNASSPTPC